MKRFNEWRPCGWDSPGRVFSCSEDYGEWFVVLGTNRDADTLTRSNWEVITKDLMRYPDCGGAEILRFGHWACGWFEILVVEPDTPNAKTAQEWLDALENYPVADEFHFSDLEYREACEFWASMRTKERIEYIRNASKYEFEFRDMAELVANVRGTRFSGYASELLS